MALSVGELVAYLTVNKSGYTRGLAGARAEMAGFTRDSNGRLRDARGRFVAEGRAAGEGLASGISRGARLANLALDGIAAGAKKVGTLTASLTMAGLAVAAVAKGLLALPQLLGVVAAASGALLLIPAAASVALVALGALKLAFVGVSDAISAGLTGDAEEFADALKGLAPAAQETVRAIVGLKPAFDELKNSVQGAVFTDLAERIRILGELYLPGLQTGFTAVGQAFNAAFQQTAGLLATAQSVSDVNTILGNASATAAGLSGALAPVVSAFRDIAAVGSQFLPGLSSGVADAATQFAAFIAHARETGQLEQWISTGLAVLKQLGAVAQDVGGIISGIFQAMGSAGSGALGPLGTLADVLNRVVNSAGGQAGLSAIFSALGSVASALEPVIGAVAVAAVPLAKIFGDLVTALGPGVTEVIKGLAKGLEAIAPVAGPVGNAISDILQACAPLLPVFGELVATLLGPLAELLSAVAKEGAPLVQMFADEMAPILPRLADALMEMVHAFTPLLPHFARLTSELLPVFVPLLNLVAVAVIGVAAVLTALGPVISWILDLISSWVGLVKDLWGAISGLDFGAIGEKITEFATTALQYISDFISGVGEFLGELPGKFMDFISEATSTGLTYFNTGLDAIINAASQIPSRIYNAASSLASRLGGLITSAVGSAATAMWNGVGDIVSAAASIPGSILRALGFVGTLLFDSGAKIVGGLIAGIKARIGELVSTVSGMISKVKGFLPFSPAKTGPFAGLGNPYYSGRSIGRLFAQGLDQQRSLVGNAAARLAGAASTSLSPSFAMAPAMAGVPSSSGGTDTGVALAAILDRLDNLQVTLADGADVVFARLSNSGNRKQGRR